MEIVARVLIGLAGAALIVCTVLSAIKTVVLPRAAVTRITRAVFLGVRRAIDVVAHPRRELVDRDPWLAMYAPMALVLLPAVWVSLVTVGFTMVFSAFGVEPLGEAFTTAGSSMLTLGFVRAQDTGLVVIEFIAAGIGLGLVSLMISYLPSIYGSFNRRETLVGMLDVRAGTPPSPSTMLTRYHRIGQVGELAESLFPQWEEWFADIEESHTSRSWITAAGCVLDTASLYASTVDVPGDPAPPLLIRTGFMSLRRIADFFGIDHPDDPRPDDPISIRREEFDTLCDELRSTGVPLRADLDQAWRDFAGWRVNYDAVLLSLCALVTAPPAPWSSDRMPDHRPGVRLLRPGRLAR
jgi:hypothetical protein